MLKYFLLCFFQAPFLTCYYIFKDEIWLILNQLLLTIFITLMDNAITLNLKNINALNINFEELLKGITKIAEHKELSLEEKWFKETEEK